MEDHICRDGQVDQLGGEVVVLNQDWHDWVVNLPERGEKNDASVTKITTNSFWFLLNAENACESIAVFVFSAWVSGTAIFLKKKRESDMSAEIE